MLRHVCTRLWRPCGEFSKLSQALPKLILSDIINFRDYHREGLFYDEENAYGESKAQGDSNTLHRRQRYSNTDSNYRDFRSKNNYQPRDRNFYRDRNSLNENRSRNFDSSFGRLSKPSFNADDLQPVLKYFYVEHSNVANRSIEDVELYRKNLNISVIGSDVPNPITSFEELCLPDDLKKVVLEQGYSEPTPIQAQGWPIALSGKDMVGISQTGSGKTLVFILPAIIHATNQSEIKIGRYECNPQVLVLAPTRELVQQILKVGHKFSKNCGLKSGCAYGGASRNNQLNSLKGAHICVATPGRLIDFVSAGLVNLQQCTYLVLDEADRMLDMGFEPQIRQIVDQIRPDRQTLMWSATWPREIRKLAEEFLTDYVQVTVGADQLVANPNIEQNIYIVEEFEKEEKLLSLLKDLIANKGSKILVFAQTKRRVDYLGMQLNDLNLPVMCIHGDVSQTKRDFVLHNFRTKKSCVLIATDVAARGLDISDIQHVVNYDLPTNIEDYIHRIGRTARGTSTGQAHSFFSEENVGLAKDLISVLEQANQSVDPQLYSILKRKNKNRGSSYPNQRWGNYQRHQYSYR
ncbi:probable ATP-dependent RNA helicase DDX5 [Trichonephila clavata]|uniref:RNA helicase n=1 Tax=Trichonephila clavata TaxID=2740835 RepID=A0A8X6LGB8_TRICU|nr:probable ATP-dependent RNA helicase DDX5 [Trichonephila clavata]